MADQFIGVPVEVDPDALFQRAVTKMRETFPNWDPKPASLAGAILRQGAMMAAVGAQIASQNDYSIFEAFGPLAGQPPIIAQPAKATTVWTMRDTVGHLIQAGTPVGLYKEGSDADPVAFVVTDDVQVSVGSSSVSIDVVAAIPGLLGTGLDSVIRADSLPFVESVAITGVSTGGADREAVPDYLNRLSQELETWTLTPIINRGFAILCRKVPGVYRAAAIDNYNPDDPDTPYEKYAAVCSLDITGSGVNTGVKTAVVDYLTFNRLVNYVVNALDPTYTIVDVTYTAHCAPDVDKDLLRDTINNAMADYLDPAYWGMPKLLRPVAIWNNDATVRLNKLIQVGEDVADCDWIEPITIGVHGGSLSATDITMTGAFPLPRAGTLTGTIVST